MWGARRTSALLIAAFDAVGLRESPMAGCASAARGEARRISNGWPTRDSRQALARAEKPAFATTLLTVPLGALTAFHTKRLWPAHRRLALDALCAPLVG